MKAPASSPNVETPAIPAHAMFVLLLCSAVTIMAGATIAPILTGMRAHFDGHTNADTLVRLVLTIPSLTVALTAVLSGYAVDRFGRKPVLISAILIYAVSGTAGYWLESLDAMLASRAILGIAKAALLTVCTTLFADYLTGAALSRGMGLQSVAMKGGGVVLLFASGFVGEISWRAPFLLYGVVLLALPGAIMGVREPVKKTREQIAAANDDSPAAIDWPIFSMLLATAFFSQVFFYQLPTELPFLFADPLFGGSVKAVGLGLSLLALVAALFAGLYHRIASRLSAWTIFTLVFATMALGYFIIGSATGLTQVFVGLAVAGVGTGLLIPNLSVWVVAICPSRVRGSLIGAITAAQFFGQFCSPLLLQPITGEAGVAGKFAVTALIMVLVSLAFLVCALVFRRQSKTKSLA
jgi:MFS family permease